MGGINTELTVPAAEAVTPVAVETILTNEVQTAETAVTDEVNTVEAEATTEVTKTEGEVTGFLAKAEAAVENLEETVVADLKKAVSEVAGVFGHKTEAPTQSEGSTTQGA